MNALTKLKLVDPDGRVSLTNLAVYVVLMAFAYCTARNGTIDVTALGSLLTALAAYRGKSWQVDKREGAIADRDVAKLKARIAELTQELDRAAKYSSTPTRSAALPPGLAR